MEKERKIEAPKGCEIEKVEIVDGVAVVITVCVTAGATKMFKSYENHRASKRRQQKVQATDCIKNDKYRI